VSLALKQARAASMGGRSGLVQQGGFFDDLFGGVKNLAGRAVRGGIGLITGGPAGALRGALTSAPSRPAIPQLGGLGQPPGPSGLALRAGQAFVPGGRTGLEGFTLACPSGFHPNKSSYFVGNGTFIQKGSRCVKNRRRNPMNPRALDRAISRVDSGKSLQGKLASITTAKWTAAGQRKHPHG